MFVVIDSAAQYRHTIREGDEVLDIKGNDQGFNAKGVWKFGRYGLWREAFEARHYSPSLLEGLYTRLLDKGLTDKVNARTGKRAARPSRRTMDP